MYVRLPAEPLQHQPVQPRRKRGWVFRQFTVEDLGLLQQQQAEIVCSLVDGKAIEFESTSLRVEKVVAAKSQGVVNVRALKAGRYEFYDDFNDKARGALNVQ